MRFTKLVIESFQVIQRADVEFGPGLNVLHGPNDIGKSTLATAIRAALLVPPSSSEATSYTPWYADVTPRVSLTFVDDAGHYWRVTKAFGGGTNTGAELQHSKDGTAFALDCKARQVEEKIRTLVAWGIPAPGGKGGPRGLPSSFLANVLLAAQTDVDAILGESLESDLDGSGKVRLTRALATLAQDPVFKKVLDAAQGEVDLYFTPMGQRRRGQTSKFTEAGKIVKQLQEDLTALQRQLVDSSAIEQSVNALRERRSQAVVRVDEANAALSTMRRRLENGRAREQARLRLKEAQATLAEIDSLANRVKALGSEVEELGGRAKAQEDNVARAVANSEAAEQALRAAEERHRIATSEDGAHQIELRRAQLAEQAAGLTVKRQTTQARKTTVEAAIKTQKDAENARIAVKAARAEFDKINGELAQSRERLKALETELEIARAIVAYGRWRSASVAAEEATKAKKSAANNRAEAGGKDAEATSLDRRARTMEESLSERQLILPTEEQAKALEQLERDLEVAEAALGGGISVAVRPRAGIAVHAFVDQKEAKYEPNLLTEHIFEAERSVHLSVGELAEIDITAGAADKRRAIETLRMRWKAEGIPVLERAAGQSLADVMNAIGVVTQERLAAVELRRGAERLRAEGKSLRERAEADEEQAAKLAANIDDLEARKAAIGATDVGILERHFAKLGKTWELKAEAQHTAKSNELRTLQTQVTTYQQAAAMAEYRISESEKRTEGLEVAYEKALMSLESSDPETLLRAVDEELRSLSQAEAENAAQLNSLAEEVNREVERAAAAVDAARESVRHAKEEHARAASALEVDRADLHARKGQHSELRSQLEAMDRGNADELVRQREHELSTIPNEPPVSEDNVQIAERELADANREIEEAKEELHKSEGALSKVGGAAVREEVERVEEALAAARIRERKLEVDADAWKLLFETLREVENEEGAHLGRALAGPVTTKFVELTGGRYKGLRLDAMLKTEAVDVPSVANGPDVLDVLSVGTRDQLATLIRLTIADQLKSTIILDDHLVHTDPTRLAWFRDVLMTTALNTQVIVLTCRPEDYLTKEKLLVGAAARDFAGGTVRVIDVARVMKRWAIPPSPPASATLSEHTDHDA
jgi:uncharacterized protein YhaN